MRIDKFLADNSSFSRSTIKEYLKKGQVSVNKKLIKKPDTKIDENNDEIMLNGTIITYSQYHYYMLNKPAGVVTANKDNLHTTVIDLLKGENTKKLSPTGRLDIDTEGLLLITDDGLLSHNLLSPSKHVNKKYFAHLDGIVTKEHVAAFKEGLDIGDDKKTKPATLTIKDIDETAGTSSIEITICEGRFHQVKRMFQAVGMKVTYLKRLSMGPLILDPSLPKGSYRPLTTEEIHDLKSCN